MRTIKYITILLLSLSIPLFYSCSDTRNEEQKSTTEKGDGCGDDHCKDEASKHNEKGAQKDEHEGEHEELPEDIVEMNADQIKLAGIQLGTIQMRQLSGVVKANGIVTTAPQNSASVSVPLGGFVKSSNLLPGSAVKKGEVLALIENTEFVDLQQSYFEVKNRYEFAEAEYNRHTELYKEDVYSQKNLQQTTSEYRSLKAQLKGVEQKLLVLGVNPSTLTEDGISATISLISPINGYIKTTNFSIGKYASPTDVLFEIVNSDKLLLELTLFETDATSISIGQLVHFTINNETHEHKASIYQVGKSINSDKTYKVYASVEMPCSNVLPGMYVLAHIEKANGQVTAVPTDAVVSFEEKDFILVFEKDKEENGKPFTEYRFIQVKKGATNDGFTEVQLPEKFDLQNSKVVLKGAYNLLSAKKNAGEMTCG